jgi:3-phosphoglycerate kinase
MLLRELKNDVDLKGKRVLVRIDANVPIVKGKVDDSPHGRIARSAVGINWLLQRGARVVVITHLGSPNGKRIPAYSVRPIAKRLSGLLGTRVKLSRTVVGKDATKAVNALQNGEVLILENIRFDAREKENSPSFAESLANLGDLYVNDAFAVSHRAHASVDAITSELPSYAGPLLSNEVAVLSSIEKKGKKPFVLVLGGLKMTTKIPIIERYISRLDHVLIGGALANAFFVAQGKRIGCSAYEKESVVSAEHLLKKFVGKIVLPIDVVVASSLRRDAKKRVVVPDDIDDKWKIVDIGPETVKKFCGVLDGAKTIVWNGPLGYCEVATFCEGTREIAKTIGARTGRALTIVGGGDTLPVIESLGLADKFTLLSTGGGALLQFLSGEPLPGIEALEI